MRAQDEMTRARKLAAEAIRIDSHVDTIRRVPAMDKDLSKRWDVGNVDIPPLLRR
jgi:acetolactate synthase regulatory subunit